MSELRSFNKNLEVYPMDFKKYGEDTYESTLQLQTKFKEVFYGVNLRNHGVVAYFHKKKNAEKYINYLLDGLKDNDIDIKNLYKGFHYSIVELNFND